MINPNTDPNEMTVEKEDFINIFLDNGSNQLEDQFFKSKIKLVNAQKGKNELFDLLKNKLKGLDMLLAVCQNNKTAIQKEDLFCLDILSNLLQHAKNDKSLHSPIVKKIKLIFTYVIKNQIALKNEDNYEELSKFAVVLLNTQYENSFYQQLTDIITADEPLFNVFLNVLFDKLFKGRNLNIKLNELKFIIRHTLSKYPSNFLLMEKLVKYLSPKGARTLHQTNNALTLLEYIIDLIRSKRDEDNKNNFKQSKASTLNNNDIAQYLKKVIEVVKENLKADIEESNEKCQSMCKYLFSELIKLHIKLSHVLMKLSIHNEGIDKRMTSVYSIFQQIIVKYGIESLKDKLEAINWNFE